MLSLNTHGRPTMYK